MHKFEKIYYDLREKIKKNDYPIGSLLPSEPDLALAYDVSRETIRKAQKRLINDGLIHKQQGKGAIVLDHESFSLPISGLVSYNELAREKGLNSKTVIIKNELTTTPLALKGLYNLKDDDPFIHLVRARVIDDEVLIIDEDYILQRRVEKIPAAIAKKSIYHYFEEEIGLVISYALKEFYADLANDLDQEWMNIHPNDYVMNVSSHVFLEDTSFFQLTNSRHRIDKFYFAEIAHRRHNI